jgi:hypothetical protein
MVIMCTYVRKRYDGSAQISVYMSVHTLFWKNAVLSTASGQALPVQSAAILTRFMVLYAFFTFFSMRLIFQLMSCAQSQRYSLQLHGAVHISCRLVTKRHYLEGYTGTTAWKSVNNKWKVQYLQQPKHVKRKHCADAAKSTPSAVSKGNKCVKTKKLI